MASSLVEKSCSGVLPRNLTLRAQIHDLATRRRKDKNPSIAVSDEPCPSYIWENALKRLLPDKCAVVAQCAYQSIPGVIIDLERIECWAVVDRESLCNLLRRRTLGRRTIPNWRPRRYRRAAGIDCDCYGNLTCVDRNRPRSQRRNDWRI